MVLGALAVLPLQARAAGAGIIWIDLLGRALDRFLLGRIIAVRARDLGGRLALHLLLTAQVQQSPDRVFLYRGGHVVEHVIARHLVLNQRISLAISLQADALTQLLHVVDVIHPMPVDDLQQDHALYLTHLLGIWEHGLRFLIKLHACLLYQLYEIVRLELLLLLLRQCDRLMERENRPHKGVELAHIPL